MSLLRRSGVACLTLLAAFAAAQTRISDVIYMKSGGAVFTMDVLKPASPNKAGVIFMVSGGWVSDHSMISSLGGGVEKAFSDAGFTVFSVVHGAQPRYKVPDIVEQVRTAAKFIQAHAADYGVEPGRLGVTGISSGGHLSLMIGGAPDTPVKAVAAIAPPTDLGNWGKADHAFVEESNLAVFVPALGIDPKAPKEELNPLLKLLSPINLITSKYPATLIVHGDSDTLVPVQQAQVMDKALGEAKVEHKLVVVPGAGHDGPAFIAGVTNALEWFREKLLK